LEAFGTGTAGVVCPISLIHFKGIDLEIPISDDSLANRLLDNILAIQHGEVDHPYTFTTSEIINFKHSKLYSRKFEEKEI
jgi:hypothetical protein